MCHAWGVHRFLSCLCFLLVSCGDPSATWEVVERDLPGALLSVWGASSSDIWTVGGDARDGSGPMVLRYDGNTWSRVETGRDAGALWWVFGFSDGPVFLGGEGGVILRWNGSAFEEMTTPGTTTVFGIWGASPDEVWAVGGVPNTSGFVWRLRDGAWEDVALPEGVGDAAIWKAFGSSANDVWFVGENGLGMRWTGSAFEQDDTGVATSLFTVHGVAGRYAAVGGLGNGVIIERDGTGWHDVTPAAGFAGLSGVVLGEREFGVAVGTFGVVLERRRSGWAEVDLGVRVDQNLHGVWIDPDGDVWAVGGQTLSAALNEGILLHRTR